MKIILETPRLTLAELELSDAGFIIRLMNSPGWLQYIGDRNMHTIAAAEEYLQNGPIKHYQEPGFGLWKMCLRESGTPIGLCGFLKRDYLDDADIGYALLPEFTGCGYAGEAVKACLIHGKKTLRLNRVAAIVQPDNARSVHLLTQQGFIVEQLITLPQSTTELQLFGLDLTT